MFISVFKSVILIVAFVTISIAPQADAVGQSQTTTPTSGQQLDADQLFAEFSQAWDDSKWEKDHRGSNYIRETGDAGWKARAETLKQLVAGGKASIPAIEKHLIDENTAVRILAAQAIGYLAPLANIEKLTEVVRKDTDPAVRLYAVDAIGMSGQGEKFNWDTLEKFEKNRDVLKHINYARSRAAQGVENSVTTALAQMPDARIDSAKVGEPAPEFTLNSVDGKQYSLSQFKGKQPVVLVFIYGDT